MKKLIQLIIPVLLLMSACNNKSQSGDATTPTADSPKAVSATPMPCDTCVTGGGTSAIVFIDKTNFVGVNAVTVQAIQNGKVMGTTTTNENGQYAFTGLANGAYSFAAVTNGKVYKNDTAKGITYSGTPSLPAIPLDSVK
jgi:hypothetical protein